MLRFGAIFLLATACVAAPAYFLLRAELSDPDNIVPGIAVMLLAPAIGWVVPLAMMLLVLWWRGSQIRVGYGAILGASAVVLYTLIVAIYLLIVGRLHGVEYVIFRLGFSLPSIVLAACFTELAFLLMMRVFAASRQRDTHVTPNA